MATAKLNEHLAENRTRHQPSSAFQCCGYLHLRALSFDPVHCLSGRLQIIGKFFIGRFDYRICVQSKNHSAAAAR